MSDAQSEGPQKPAKNDNPPSTTSTAETDAQLVFEVGYGHNVKTLPLQDIVFRPPVCIEVTEFDYQASKAFETAVAAALRTGQPVLPVIIDSFGGEIYALNRMLDAVRAAQKRGLQVWTVAAGKAMSCGSILFAVGDRRYMTSESFLMIHDAWSFEWGKTSELRENTKHLEQLDRRGYQILDLASGKPDGYWQQRVHDIGHADLYLTADECFKDGLATHIGTPNLAVGVQLVYTVDGKPLAERKR